MTRTAQKELAKWIVANTIFKAVAFDVIQQRRNNTILPVYVKGLEYINTSITDTSKTVCYIRPISDAVVDKPSCNALATIQQTVRAVFYSNRSDKNPRFIINQILSSGFGACVTKVHEDRYKLFEMEQKGMNLKPFYPNTIYFAIDIDLMSQSPVCDDTECLIKDGLICN